MSSSIQVQPTSTIPIWGGKLVQARESLYKYLQKGTNMCKSEEICASLCKCNESFYKYSSSHFKCHKKCHASLCKSL